MKNFNVKEHPQHLQHTIHLQVIKSKSVKKITVIIKRSKNSTKRITSKGGVLYESETQNAPQGTNKKIAFPP